MSDAAGNGGQFKIVNAYDEVVRKTVHEVMSAMDMCKCEKCYLDACALVFNNGYTKFVTTSKGALYANLVGMNNSRQIQLKMAAAVALRRIKENPAHDI
ncbi:late competence development ComFB family protein [Ruminococcaceae bacterium OttesenSCG-928-D13]|nr:late competence development ComFB family protein [Ruminococcaceae bacterium OttesenSCG-928-D13]